MTEEDREYRFVVEPLIGWLKKQNWCYQTPEYHTSARGWDIEAGRKNECLLIEAKYISGPSIAVLAGLVAAPLANRALRLKIPECNERAGIKPLAKLVPWCCWAIGINPPGQIGSEVYKSTTRNMYQILFDFMGRNSKFWKHYGEDLRMKYIFFVEKGEITRIPFTDFLFMTKQYVELTRADGKKLKERRQIAEDLLNKYRSASLFK